MAVGDNLYPLRHYAGLSGPAAVALDAKIEGNAGGIDVRLDAHDVLLTSLDGRLDTAEPKITSAEGDIDGLEAACIVVAIDDAADVGGGGTTQTVGLQLKNQKGVNVSAAHVLTFGAFADANGAAASSGGTLNTATAGTILSGAGTAALKVVTSSAGKFTCTLTDEADEAVHLIAGPTVKSPLLDCRDTDSVTFSA